ncbi:MAG: YihA family ribosome biogenesis GTP-binding protein [Bacteroidetes bacterium]|jgi:GTP-binding protein|nr:YihA family ribosome biogenesis GTP-binding protein [Bacteroidota bacterium]
MAARNLPIHIEAEFVTSSSQISQCPLPKIPEFAFIGRSNVGKSSLINFLTNRKELALVSGTPGKTRTINHFLINKTWYLVDLPGYGYAMTGKSEREKFEKLNYSYLLGRENLVCTFLLIDSRIPPQKIDLDFMSWLGGNGIPFELVFTKADRSKKTDFIQSVEQFEKAVLAQWEEMPKYWITSVQDKLGREELLGQIIEYHNTYAKIIRQQYEQQDNDA